MQDFSGKGVVITGAAAGIGFALAKQFSSQGARVLLADIRSDRLEQAAATLQAGGAEVATFVCDVTDRAQVEALAEHAWEVFGQVDVIVNNAGVGPIGSSVIDANPADVQRVLDVNLFGVWNGVSVFGRRFLAQTTPSAIYIVGSENCFFNAVPLGAGYVASKHAVLAMTMALREEVPSHIDVALICPGLVQSDLSPETSLGMDTDEFATRVMEQIRSGQELIVTHGYNVVRIESRYQEVAAAYRQFAPRHDGDDRFDVRVLGERHHWYPELPLPAVHSS